MKQSCYGALEVWLGFLRTGSEGEGITLQGVVVPPNFDVHQKTLSDKINNRLTIAGGGSKN